MVLVLWRYPADIQHRVISFFDMIPFGRVYIDGEVVKQLHSDRARVKDVCQEDGYYC